MASLPVEILSGIYLGVLTGIIPALVAGTLGFIFRYFTGVTIPGFGVVVLSLAIAGVNGGILALYDQSILRGAHGPAVVVAILVILMLSMYAHAQGDKLGDTLPRRMSIRALTERTLSADVVEFVGNRREVRVAVAGEVGDMEGYPPLSPSLRAEIGEGTWTFPADVPVSELETRLADRLRSDYDLADASVALDERARATIHAAPPVGGLSKRVPPGKRAVSIDALVPTGIARGESVRVVTSEGPVTGTVVSADSGDDASAVDPDGATTAPPATAGGGTDEKEEAATSSARSAPVTVGGEGRITVAVDRADAGTLLRAERGRVVVLSRGTRREFELLSLFRRAGKRIRKVAVGADGPLDGATIGEAAVRDAYGVGVLAVRRDRWRFVPDGSTALSPGDELFVVGSRDSLAAFAEVVA
ncbi:potassium channel family protein [Halegenticoccus tardaugens]|uniref:potassium channel family protein n=1 Tax=Halegenticoccus tardaugens TaxID=2071624 RepID=UPI00100B3C87|nr:TrkA C-terminal domain-containing protein [Halegenticoccus tardaugens]